MAGARSDIEAGKAHVTLWVKDNAFTRGLSNAQKRLNKFGSGMMSIGTRVAGVGAAIMGAMGAAGVAFASAGDKLDKMSGRTGVAADKLSALKFAAESSGTSIDAVGSTIQKMNRRIGRLTAGQGASSQIEALNELGLTIEQLDKMNPEQRFMAMADAIAGYGDQAAAAGLAQRAMGAGVDKLLPLFKGGSEGIKEMMQQARELGITMTNEDAVAAAKLTDALGKVKGTLSGVAMQIGAAVAPAMTKMADLIADAITPVVNFIKENRELVVALGGAGFALVGLGTALGTLATGFAVAGFAASGLATAIGLIATPVGAAAFVIGGLSIAIGGVMLSMVDWQDVIADLNKSIEGIGDAIANGDIEGAMELAMAGAKAALFAGIADIMKGMEGMNRDIADSMPFFMKPAEFVMERTGDAAAGMSIAAERKQKSAEAERDKLALQQEQERLRREDEQARKDKNAADAASSRGVPLPAYLRDPGAALGGAIAPMPIPNFAMGGDFAGFDASAFEDAMQEAKELTMPKVDGSGLSEPERRAQQVAGTFSAAGAMRLGLGGTNTPDERTAKNTERIAEAVEGQTKLIKKRRGAVFT